MYDLSSFLWLIPVLPLAAAALIALFGPKVLRVDSHWPCILALAGSCVLSFLVLSTVLGMIGLGESETPNQVLYQKVSWFTAGNVDVSFGLRADPLSAIMLVTVTFIGSLIAIFSVGYMHGEDGYPRFFAEIALFIGAMTTLVLADNFILLYAGWEGVGLCSYLLIGFWFTKPSAAAAARKAFLVTRLGDVGLLLGILTLWATLKVNGLNLYSLDFETIFGAVQHPHHQLPVAVVCFLLFCGAVGKSAQFPLHVWLPDAMEGPTPVSALIHAATMVTAGVYLVARCTPLFVDAPGVQLLVATIGAFTALLAALIAMTQNDLKRVLAYSTISQLGYMFLALGSAVMLHGADGGEVHTLVTIGVTAAIFHLFTHAFFKALLFLGAGSVMHAMGGVIDIRRFGGLRKILPVTHMTFLCGAAALAGVPLLSGFWSKDEILGATFSNSKEAEHFRPEYSILFIVGLVTAGLTAFYTFRAYFKTFWGEERVPEEAGRHAHESPAVMTVPLIVLAIGAVTIGAIVGPMTHWFGHLLGHLPDLDPSTEHHENWSIMAISGVVAVGGIVVAWFMYVAQPGLPGRLVQHMQLAYQMSLNKFEVDELYDTFVVRPLLGFAEFCRLIDHYLVDGIVDLIGHVPRLLADFLFRPMQNGLVQFYALAMVLGLTVFLIALARAL
jgi:NADH-quinone oxidoreductase subunit L